MINLSKTAVREVLRMKSKHQNPQAFFRIGTQTSGCSGLSYALQLEDVQQAEDQVYDCEGIQVLVSSESLPLVQGMTLDYSEDLMGGGFRFHNPNAAQTCGCGSSFAVA